MTSRRPPDAGTDNQWTIVGDARVVAVPAGQVAPMGRRVHDDTDLVLIIQDHRQKDGPTVVITKYQAEILGQVLPAVVANLDRQEGD